MKISQELKLKLISSAEKVCEQSYSPYSGLQVGAAILTKDGQIFCGTNIENASYSVTLCAERVALASAVSQGHQSFVALALTYRGKGIKPDQILPPCGVCRQSLVEFAEPNGSDIVIIMVSADKSKQEIKGISTLLPISMKLEKYSA